MKYRKKAVTIEAIKYQAEFGNNRIMNWLAQQGANVQGWLFHDDEITIPTLEGRMRVSDGDWIIKGVKGEFYPCKPDIFAETYEALLDFKAPSFVNWPASPQNPIETPTE